MVHGNLGTDRRIAPASGSSVFTKSIFIILIPNVVVISSLCRSDAARPDKSKNIAYYFASPWGQ